MTALRAPTRPSGHPLFRDFVPIVRPDLPPAEELAGRLGEVLSSGMITNHRFVREFELALAEHLGVKHAVCVSSCTSGMMLLLKGLGLTGEVVVPSFTFMATAAAVAWAGCSPVFVDVDEETMVVDPDEVERAVTPRTSGVLAVHNFGRPAPVERLEEIARSRGLRLIFDSAHGLGSLRRGRPVGGFGDAEVFSLSPTKLVTSAEGGVVATDSDEIAELVMVGRNYGMGTRKGPSHVPTYDCLFPGLSARMSELHAVLGLAGLERLEAGVRRRNEIASLYRERLGRLPGVSFQSVDPEDRSSYKDFTIVVDEAGFGLGRHALGEALRRENIDSRRYYDPPCHRMTAFAPLARGDTTVGACCAGGRGPARSGAEIRTRVVSPLLPRTERLSARCLSIPIWSGMDDDTASGICLAIERIGERAAGSPTRHSRFGDGAK